MRNAIKTIGWLIISWVLIALGVYWKTSDLTLAFASTLPGVLLKTPFYSLYEWLWEGRGTALGNHTENALEDAVEALELAVEAEAAA